MAAGYVEFLPAFGIVMVIAAYSSALLAVPLVFLVYRGADVNEPSPIRSLIAITPTMLVYAFLCGTFVNMAAKHFHTSKVISTVIAGIVAVAWLIGGWMKSQAENTALGRVGYVKSDEHSYIAMGLATACFAISSRGGTGLDSSALALAQFFDRLFDVFILGGLAWLIGVGVVLTYGWLALKIVFTMLVPRRANA